MDAKNPSDATPATNPAEIGSKSVETPAVVAPAEVPRGAFHTCPTCSGVGVVTEQTAIAHAQRSSVYVTDTMVKRAEDFFYDNSPFTGPEELREGLRGCLTAALREQGGQAIANETGESHDD